MHRSNKICVRDWEAGRRADHRVDAAMWADGRSALVLHPFLDIIDREYLSAEEAATNIANVQLRFVIGGVTVRSFKRLKRKTHRRTFVVLRNVRNGVGSGRSTGRSKPGG